MKVLGHRGASGTAPENTIAAIKKAFELGADGIEFDVQQTKDGELVVFHDWTLERTTDGNGKLRNYELEDLKTLDAGSWFSEKFRGEKIPTLKEIMDIVPEGKIINIEIKEEALEEDRKTEEVIVKFLENYKNFKNCEIIVSSFNHHLLRKIKKLDSEIKIGILLETNLINVEKYISSLDFDVYSYHPDKRITEVKEIKKIQEAQRKINVWTVNEEEDKKRLEELGVDSIITNYPEKFIKK